MPKPRDCVSNIVIFERLRRASILAVGEKPKMLIFLMKKFAFKDTYSSSRFTPENPIKLSRLAPIPNVKDALVLKISLCGR